MIPVEQFRKLKHRDQAIIAGTALGLFDAHHSLEEVFSYIFILLDEEDRARIVADMNRATKSSLKIVR